jgi:short-subunit dehydrogenase
MKVIKRLMDVNFFGAVGVVDKLLPYLMRSPEGVRLLTINSVTGLVATPNRTGYSASKFAMKGFFDSLRQELVATHANGTFITAAYPGAVRTSINSSRLGLSSKKPTGLTFEKVSVVVVVRPRAP